MTAQFNHVAAIIELTTIDAQNDLRSELRDTNFVDCAFSENAGMSVCNLLSNILASSGRQFNATLSKKLGEASFCKEAGNAFEQACRAFLDHLDKVFLAERARHSWGGEKDPQTLDPWREARRPIELEISIIGLEFEPEPQPGAMAVGSAKGGTPANRQLDHDEIIRQAAALRAGKAGISKGSVAASIINGLGVNPRTKKPWDNRHIERMIGHLWEGDFAQSPP